MYLRLPLFAAALLFACTATASDWPQWRGPDRTGISKETGLLKKWPDNGPPKAWTVSLPGGGHGSPIVVDGKIYVLAKKGSDEVAVCLKESDGSAVWEKAFNTLGKDDKIDRNVGPRCTPTFHNDPKIGKVIYGLGVTGNLTCFKADTGEIVWKKSFPKDFGGRMMSQWGYSESVLVDGDKLICSPGSDSAAIVALKPATGEVIWKSEIKNCGGASYCSPLKAEIGGIPMYINLLGKTGGLVGVDPATGKVLWQYTGKAATGGTAQVPMPIVKGNLVWVSTSYGGGAALIELTTNGKSSVTVKELKSYPRAELSDHHGGMVLVGDYVYFGHNQNEGYPVCVEMKTGEIKWGPEKYPAGAKGSAAVIYADGMLYFRYQNHHMVLIEPSPEGLKVVSSFKMPDWSGVESWAHPVIANGNLYIRDQDKLHRFNLKADKN
jgi:outer membrane protein assembly factor BamB